MLPACRTQSEVFSIPRLISLPMILTDSLTNSGRSMAKSGPVLRERAPQALLQAAKDNRRTPSPRPLAYPPSPLPCAQALAELTTRR